MLTVYSVVSKRWRYRRAANWLVALRYENRINS